MTPSGAAQEGREVACELEVTGEAAGTTPRHPGAVRPGLREPGVTALIGTRKHGHAICEDSVSIKAK